MPNIKATSLADFLADAPVLLTAEEVASLLRIATVTVIRWSKEDRLLSIKVGPRLHRFPKVSIEKYLRDTVLSNTSS